MADVVQQAKTKIITFSIPSGLVTDEYPIDIDQIKQLGLYTRQNFEELKDLFLDILDAINRNSSTLYELYPNQEIHIKIKQHRNSKEEGIPVELEVSNLRPNEPNFHGSPKTHLFFVDAVSLILGIATTLQREFYAKELQSRFLEDFKDPDTETYYLQQWGRSGGRLYLSQEAMQRETAQLSSLFERVVQALLEIEENLAKEAAGETQEPERETKEKEPNTAEISERVEELVQNLRDSNDSGDGNQSDQNGQQTYNFEDPDNQTRLLESRNFVLASLRANVLDRIFEQGGYALSDLPDSIRGEAQQLHDELQKIIEDELNTIIGSLSDAEKAELIGTGALIARTKLYQRALQILFGRSNRFIVNYQKFYDLQINSILDTDTATTDQNTIEQQCLRGQKTIDALQQFITSVTAQPELSAIHAELETWKQSLQEKYALLDAKRTAENRQANQNDDDDQQGGESKKKPDQQEETQTKTQDQKSDQDTADSSKTGTDDYEPELSEREIPDAPQVLTPTQLQTFISTQSVQTLPQQTQQVLAKQAAQVTWGAMAQLFSEDTLKANSIPPQLFTTINTQTIEYLSNLSPAELQKLSKSPSSLIRHIKNITLRIQRDAGFAVEYQNFQQKFTTPAINRTERIEIEAAWAIENAKYELFTSHNITSDLIFNDEKLKKEYIEAEHALETKVYAYILQLSTEELLELYINPQKRDALFAEITKSLSADPKFRKELGELYTELIHYYQEHGIINTQEDLAAIQRDFNKTSSAGLLTDEGGVRFIIDDIKHVDAQKLFAEQLKSEINIDSPVFLEGTAKILDGMLLAYGQEHTIKMVQDIDAQLLGTIFNLSENVTGKNHKTLREVLINYAKVRSVNLSPAEGATTQGFITTPYEKPTAQNINKQLSSVRSATQLASENGTEATADAATGNIRKKAQIFEKLMGNSWNNLTPEQQAAFRLLDGFAIPQNIRDRLNSNTTDLVADRFPPTFSILSYRGDIADLVEAARAGKFKELVFAAEQQEYDEAYRQAVQNAAVAQRISNEMNLALWEAADAAYKAEVAAQNQTTIEAISNQYIQAIQENAQGRINTTDAVATGAGIAAGASFGATNFTRGIPLPYGSQDSALGNVAGGKIRQLAGIANTFSQGIKIARAASGDLTAATQIAYSFFSSPRFREVLLATGTAGTAWLLSILANPLSLASILGSIGMLGLSGIAPGFALGGAFRLAFPNFRFPGITVRTPANPFSMGSDAAEGSVRGYRSMSEMRGGQNAQSQSAQTASGTNSTNVQSPDPQTASRSMSRAQNTNASIRDTAQGSGAYSPYANPATGAATTSSIWSLANIGLLAPVMAMAPVFILTIFTIVVISGAFLVDLPTKPFSKSGFNNTGQQVSEKYVTVTKTPDKGANPKEIPNNTALTVAYTVTIQPKPGYTIKINEATDTFSSFGDQVSPNPITSTFRVSQIPTEVLTTAAPPITYVAAIDNKFKDAYITNTFSITFDVMDSTGNSVETNQIYNASANVLIGEPKIGCWPVTGVITTYPFMKSVPTHAKSDAFDIGAPLGTPIHAPFPGFINDKGLDTTGYGNLLTLEFVLPGDSTQQHRVVFFGHLSGVAEKFRGKKAEAVVAGEIIGFVGSTGNSTGPHLHYELRNDRDYPDDPGLGLRNIVPGGLSATVGTPTRSCK